MSDDSYIGPTSEATEYEYVPGLQQSYRPSKPYFIAFENRAGDDCPTCGKIYRMYLMERDSDDPRTAYLHKTGYDGMVKICR